MNVFDKVAQSDTIVKDTMEKRGFVGAILKSLGSMVKRNPLGALSTASNAAEVSSRTAQSEKTIRDAKNRANIRNLNTRV